MNKIKIITPVKVELNFHTGFELLDADGDMVAILPRKDHAEQIAAALNATAGGEVLGEVLTHGDHLQTLCFEDTYSQNIKLNFFRHEKRLHIHVCGEEISIPERQLISIRNHLDAAIRTGSMVVESSPGPTPSGARDRNGAK